MHMTETLNHHNVIIPYVLPLNASASKGTRTSLLPNEQPDLPATRWRRVRSKYTPRVPELPENKTPARTLTHTGLACTRYSIALRRLAVSASTCLHNHLKCTPVPCTAQCSLQTAPAATQVVASPFADTDNPPSLLPCGAFSRSQAEGTNLYGLVRPRYSLVPLASDQLYLPISSMLSAAVPGADGTPLTACGRNALKSETAPNVGGLGNGRHNLVQADKICSLTALTSWYQSYSQLLCGKPAENITCVLSFQIYVSSVCAFSLARDACSSSPPITAQNTLHPPHQPSPPPCQLVPKHCHSSPTVPRKLQSNRKFHETSNRTGNPTTGPISVFPQIPLSLSGAQNTPPFPPHIPYSPEIWAWCPQHPPSLPRLYACTVEGKTTLTGNFSSTSIQVVLATNKTSSVPQATHLPHIPLAHPPSLRPVKTFPHSRLCDDASYPQTTLTHNSPHAQIPLTPPPNNIFSSTQAAHSTRSPLTHPPSFSKLDISIFYFTPYALTAATALLLWLHLPHTGPLGTLDLRPLLTLARALTKFFRKNPITRISKSRRFSAGTANHGPHPLPRRTLPCPRLHFTPHHTKQPPPHSSLIGGGPSSAPPPRSFLQALCEDLNASIIDVAGDGQCQASALLLTISDPKYYNVIAAGPRESQHTFTAVGNLRRLGLQLVRQATEHPEGEMFPHLQKVLSLDSSPTHPVTQQLLLRLSPPVVSSFTELPQLTPFPQWGSDDTLLVTAQRLQMPIITISIAGADPVLCAFIPFTSELYRTTAPLRAATRLCTITDDGTLLYTISTKIKLDNLSPALESLRKEGHHPSLLLHTGSHYQAIVPNEPSLRAQPGVKNILPLLFKPLSRALLEASEPPFLTLCPIRGNGNCAITATLCSAGIIPPHTVSPYTTPTPDLTRTITRLRTTIAEILLDPTTGPAIRGPMTSPDSLSNLQKALAQFVQPPTSPQSWDYLEDTHITCLALILNTPIAIIRTSGGAIILSWKNKMPLTTPVPMGQLVGKLRECAKDAGVRSIILHSNNGQRPSFFDHFNAYIYNAPDILQRSLPSLIPVPSQSLHSLELLNTCLNLNFPPGEPPRPPPNQKRTLDPPPSRPPHPAPRPLLPPSLPAGPKKPKRLRRTALEHQTHQYAKLKEEQTVRRADATAFKDWPDEVEALPHAPPGTLPVYKCLQRGPPKPQALTPPQAGNPPTTQDPPTSTPRDTTPKRKEPDPGPPDDRPVVLPPLPADFHTLSKTPPKYWRDCKDALRHSAALQALHTAATTKFISTRDLLLLNRTSKPPSPNFLLQVAIQAFSHHHASTPALRPSLLQALVSTLRSLRFARLYGKKALTQWTIWAKAQQKPSQPICPPQRAALEAAHPPRPRKQPRRTAQTHIGQNLTLTDLPKLPPRPHSEPPATEKPQLYTLDEITIVTYNCAGLSDHSIGACRTLSASSDIICFQETKKLPDRTPNRVVAQCLSKYTCLYEPATLRQASSPTDPQNPNVIPTRFASGGLLTALSSRLAACSCRVPTPLPMRGLVLETLLNTGDASSTVLFNIYAPPDFRHRSILHYTETRIGLARAAGRACIVVGDFNAALDPSGRKGLISKNSQVSSQTAERDSRYQAWLTRVGLRPTEPRPHHRPPSFVSLSPANPRTARLDDILISEGAMLTARTVVLHVGRSDHSPVQAILSPITPWCTPAPPPSPTPPPVSQAKYWGGALIGRKYTKAERKAAGATMHEVSLSNTDLNTLLGTENATPDELTAQLTRGLLKMQAAVSGDKAPKRFQTPARVWADAYPYTLRGGKTKTQHKISNCKRADLKRQLYQAVEDENEQEVDRLLRALAAEKEEYRAHMNKSKLEEKTREHKRLIHAAYNKPKEVLQRIFTNKSPGGAPPPKAASKLKDPKTGRITENPEDCVRIMYDYSSQQAQRTIPPREPGATPPWQRDLDPIASFSKGTGESNLHLFTKAAFFNQINKLPTGRAAGHDGLVYESIKALDITIKEALYIIMKRLYTAATIPGQFRISKIWLLIKSELLMTDPAYLRPISLFSVLAKLFTGCVNYLLAAFTERHNIISPLQSGFRAKKCTADLSHILASVYEDANLNRRRCQVLYVDWKQAFPSIPHDRLMETLRLFGCPNDLIQVIRALYEDQKAIVITPYGETQPFDVTLGGLQGEKLTPLLWLIFMQPLLLWLEAGNRGYLMSQPLHNGTHVRVPHVTFADDLAATTDSPENMQTQVHKIAAFNQEWCGSSSLGLTTLDLGISKCALTGLCWPNPQSPRPGTKTDLQKALHSITYRRQGELFGKPFPFLASNEPYKHLGLLIRPDLNWEEQHKIMLDTITKHCTQLTNFRGLPDDRIITFLEWKIIGEALFTANMHIYTPAQLDDFDRKIHAVAKKALGQGASAPQHVISLPKSDFFGAGVQSLTRAVAVNGAHQLAEWLREGGDSFLGNVTRALLRAYYVRAGIHPTSNLPNILQDPTTNLPFARRLITLNSHGPNDTPRFETSAARLNTPDTDPSAMPIAAMYPGLDPMAQPRGLLGICQLGAMGITDITQLLSPVIQGGGNARAPTSRAILPPSEIIRSAPALKECFKDNRPSGAQECWALTPLSNLALYWASEPPLATEMPETEEARRRRTAASEPIVGMRHLATSLFGKARSRTKPLNPSQSSLKAIPNLPVTHHTNHDPTMDPELHPGHSQFKGSVQYTMEDGEQFITKLDNDSIYCNRSAGGPARGKRKLSAKTPALMPVRTEREADEREYNVQILAKRISTYAPLINTRSGTTERAQYLLRFGPCVCTKAEIEHDLCQGYTICPTMEAFPSSGPGPWPVPPHYTVLEDPYSPPPAWDPEEVPLEGRNYADLYDRPHINSDSFKFLVYYTPEWENPSLVNITDGQIQAYEERCARNAKYQKTGHHGDAPEDQTSNPNPDLWAENGTSSSANTSCNPPLPPRGTRSRDHLQARNPFEKNPCPNLQPTDVPIRQQQDPAPNLSIQPEDACPELDAIPTGAYEAYTPPQNFKTPMTTETDLVGLFTPSGRCRGLFSYPLIQGLYNLALNTTPTPDADNEPDNEPVPTPTQIKSRTLRSVGNLIEQEGLHRWGPGTDLSTLKEWARSHALNPIPDLYADPDHTRTQAINLSFNPLDSRALHLRQVSLNDDHLPFALAIDQDKLIWAGSCYHLTLNPNPRDAADQLRKAIKDAQNAPTNPTLGIITGTINSLTLAKHILDTPAIQVAGIYYPTASQRADFKSFIEQPSSAQLFPCSPNPHFLLSVSNIAGRIKYARNDLRTIPAFKQVHTHHHDHPPSETVQKTLGLTYKAIHAAKQKHDLSQNLESYQIPPHPLPPPPWRPPRIAPSQWQWTPAPSPFHPPLKPTGTQPNPS